MTCVKPGPATGAVGREDLAQRLLGHQPNMQPASTIHDPLGAADPALGEQLPDALRGATEFRRRLPGGDHASSLLLSRACAQAHLQSLASPRLAEPSQAPPGQAKPGPALFQLACFLAITSHNSHKRRIATANPAVFGQSPASKSMTNCRA